MTVEERRKRHRLALVQAEMTQTAFCESLDLSVNHVNEVLLGRRKSARVDAALERFAGRHLGR